MQSIKITEKDAGQRLDKMLIKYLNKAPKSFIYKMLRKKNITLNGKKAHGSEKLLPNDEIKLFLSDETIENFSEIIVKKVDYQLNIIYEDNNILILNKPAGLLSQKAQKEDVSLVEHLISYLLDKGEITEETLKRFRPGICNRLDRNTSGIIIAGKSLMGLQKMSELLKNRNIDKYYQCIVKGEVKEKQLIDGYLVKDTSHNKVTISKEATDGSEYIKTQYEPLKSNGAFTLLKVKLLTGKSHQIRAHLKSIGHPIIGDGKYGDVAVNKMMKKTYKLKHHLLHSWQLELPEMEGEFSHLSKKVIEAPLPNYFKELIEHFIDP